MKKLLSLALCLCLLLVCLPMSALAYEAVLSPQSLTVDGVPVDCEKYNIDGSNYFNLRDLACLLNETPYTFSVSWDAAANAVIIAPGFPYEPVGGELTVGEDKAATAVPSAQTVWYLDAPVEDLSVYNIGGNNYFKLRDLGNLLGFEVGYDADTNTATVSTGFADAPLGNVNQAVACWRLREWVDANADRDIMGKEYIDTVDWDDGESAMLSLIDTGSGTVALVLTYADAQGDYERSWIYLHPEADDYYAVYSYYAGGDEPGFTGTLELDPAAFAYDRPTEFFDVEGELTGLEDYDFWSWASEMFGFSIAWLDSLTRTVPALANVSIYDFGFTDAAVYYETSEAPAADGPQAAAFDSLYDWAAANINDTVDGSPAYTREELLVGAGARVSVSILPLDFLGERLLELCYSYTYATGDTDAAFLFLDPAEQVYYAGYEHYAPGAEEPDFFGDFPVDAAAFNGAHPVDFDESYGDAVGTDFAVSARYLAVYSLCDLLVQFDELCRLTIAPDGAYDIAAFGFDTARLSTAELAMN